MIKNRYLISHCNSFVDTTYLYKKCDQKKPDDCHCCHKKHSDCICNQKKPDDCHCCHKKHNDCICDQKKPDDCHCCHKKHSDCICNQKKPDDCHSCHKKHNDCICDQKKTDDCHLCHKKHNDCHCDDKKHNLVRASAFRANKNTPQLYEAALTPSVKVLFQTEQFDLADEYNPHISTFIPTKDGIYEITAKVSFCPSKSKSNDSSKNKKDNCKCDYCKKNHSSKDKKKHFLKEGYVASIAINVNGDDLDIVNDFFGKSRPIGLSVTTILQLQAGDWVQVIFSAGANGEILAETLLTNFQAARFPSPM
ncbi:hypothetical protein [Peribacillus sp. FSL M8-0224]|uniref:hypothetical protein n=1 Tax=Peribacillus sp. FSL M8-0224 TaxID=2921568 RepID=UPI0030F9B87A|nr:hypothetical protein KY492_15880 [Brevibacterium sp. PAMC21349]